MPGEVNSTLGTAAYMAPEVITRAKGKVTGERQISGAWGVSSSRW
uniref:Uncharacterized protein n=1 Tax=Anguilla anguilla TaxID=7936 RepID=A0A0E9VMK0_ANGAN